MTASPETPGAVDAPEVVVRYLKAADARDAQALADCFTSDATVLDEGVTHRGRDEIVAWRTALASAWEYTTTVTGSEPIGAGTYVVRVRIEGNFPGGVADLAYRFTLDRGLIEALVIGG